MDQPTCSLYRVDLSGAATKVGDYSTTGGLPEICNGRIDADGVLFFGLTTIGGSRIARRPLAPADMSYVYVNTLQTIWDNNQRFNLILRDGNGIVTGP